MVLEKIKKRVSKDKAKRFTLNLGAEHQAKLQKILKDLDTDFNAFGRAIIDEVYDDLTKLNK